MEPKSNLLRLPEMELCRNGLKLTIIGGNNFKGWSTGTGGRGGAGEQLDFLNQILVANENTT